jgi:hypothetical protein
MRWEIFKSNIFNREDKKENKSNREDKKENKSNIINREDTKENEYMIEIKLYLIRIWKVYYCIM